MLTSCEVDLDERSSLTLAGRDDDPVLIELDPISSGSPDLPCRVYDPDLWFAESPAELELAKSFCADCPARAACLAGALSRREPWGVWGGQILERGRILSRKRPRGRPRKIDREESLTPIPIQCTSSEAAFQNVE